MDRASRPRGAPPLPDAAQPVLVAGGVFQEDLQRVTELLQASAVDFEVQQTPRSAIGHDPVWRVFVAPADAERARRTLATLAPPTHAPGPGGQTGPAGPAPGPLFDSIAPELIRVTLMALCFGLALWLLLRS